GAAVEEQSEAGGNSEPEPKAQQLENRITELEKANTELKAQAVRLTRKTLSPMVSALLAKNAGEMNEPIEAGSLDKALQSLTVEQRIAVKAEMARAGVIE